MHPAVRVASNSPPASPSAANNLYGASPSSSPSFAAARRSSAAASPEAELFAASYQGNEAAARAALDEHHANVECTDTFGQTPLSAAAWCGHLAVVQLLLSRGAHVESTEENGRTPLHYAASRGHVACIELLVSHGADKSTKNKFGKTPLDVAKDEATRAALLAARSRLVVAAPKVEAEQPAPAAPSPEPPAVPAAAAAAAPRSDGGVGRLLGVGLAAYACGVATAMLLGRAAQGKREPQGKR